MNEPKPVSVDKLVADLKVVVADTDELLSATAAQTGEKMNALRARMQEHLMSVKPRLADAEAAVAARARAAAQATDAYVHENPWTTVGIAAGVGLLVGVILSRR
jgi:ElaB/YqjD/DUF883 family membrane-anchored ribosome-binding protein